MDKSVQLKYQFRKYLKAFYDDLIKQKQADPKSVKLELGKLQRFRNIVNQTDPEELFAPFKDEELEGFISGKKKYSFKVINRISEFHEFGIPLLLGPSKKSFLSNVTRGEFLNFEERDIPCTVVSSFALWRGVSILRYHEVNQGRHLIDTIELMKRNLK